MRNDVGRGSAGRKRGVPVLGLAALLVLGTLLGALGEALAQDIERVIVQIRQGTIGANTKVEIYGRIDKWRPDPSGNTWAYELRDDWGDGITVITDKGLPPTEARYRVTGIVNQDAQSGQLTLVELERAEHGDGGGGGGEVIPPIDPRQAEFDNLLGQAQSLLSNRKFKAAIPLSQQAITLGQSMTRPPAGLSVARSLLAEAEEGAKPRWLLFGLIAAVVVVAAALVLVLRRSSREPATDDFGAGIVTVTDKTQKITAAVPTQEAIQAGTVKVMPGRFEVKGGVDLKEIRLVRPRGVSDHQIEYTFGRLQGDPTRHIQLSDPTVSSRQARLKYGSEGYTFINIPDPADPDRNATLLNGAAMKADEPRVLKEGDVIRMGTVELVYHKD